ncbi:pesticin C-terminus-like muramidase [Erwinia sp. DT-104]|uniref:pesticin C-terminus-like muramidase n=1 Tax=Erwinia sp. DT-104 TaxID=3396161 RepID=UPI003F1DCD46
MSEPKKGILTFRAEGDNLKSSNFYSRKIHWPGLSASCSNNNSGVTIGRGYDMGDKTKIEVSISLQKAGIEREKAEAISKGAGLKGCSAYNFVIKNRSAISDITEKKQVELFKNTYEELKRAVERICKDRFTITKYHPDPGISPTLAWSRIPEKIKDILIDLRYRGDYNLKTRKHLQRLAYTGDMKGFGRVIAGETLWHNVPKDRFNRRVSFYENN